MKRFSVKLDSFVVSDVEALGDNAEYDHRAHDELPDYVVRRAGKEVLRVSRERILFVVISDAPGVVQD